MVQVAESKILSLLRKTSTPNISDALSRLNVKGVQCEGLLPLSPFKNPHKHVAGPAVTARFLPSRYAAREDETPRFMEVIRNAPRGSVIAFEGASISQRASELALKVGLEASVCDTATRDIDEVIGLKFPVFCPFGCIGAKTESYLTTMECVQVNAPIHMGLHGGPYHYWLGAQVRPRDIIVGDNNGVIVVPREALNKITTALNEVQAAEERMRSVAVPRNRR
jgi:regulator of RNase E activity RraA